MPFTVRDLFDLDVMQGAILVAGEQGLSNQISFVNIMETPEVAKFMKGGEFLISAGFALSQDDTACRRLIREFAEKGIAAFGINVGRYLHAIPPAMVEAANQYQLPLIILPKNMPYMDIMTAVWNKTVSQRVLSDKSKNFYNVLLDVILSERGIVGICNTLAMLTNNPVFLLDASYNLLSASVNPKDLQSSHGLEMTEVLKAIRRLQVKCAFQTKALPQHGHYQPANSRSRVPLLVMPVLVNNNINGYLFILELQKELTEDEILALQDTGAIIALEMLKEKAVLEVQRRTQGELLEDLLSGYYRDGESFARHLKGLDFQAKGPLTVLFFNLAQPGNIPKTQPRSGKQYDFKSKLMNLVGEHARRNFQGALLASRSDCVICLLSLGRADRLAELQELGPHLTAGMGPGHISAIGVSNPFTALNQVQEAYHQAKIAARATPPSPTLTPTFYQDMGVYLLLNEIKELPAAKSFYQLYLQTLADYDQKDGELLKTLEAYFANGGNLRKTAETLYVHKNSVAYRLQKIQQLTGLSLSNPSHRFNLELALYLLKVF